jgi:nicotinamide N-methyltransferase
MLQQVVLTDYPDKALLDNLTYNVAQNLNVQPPPGCPCPATATVCSVLGYVWGSPVDPLLDALLPVPDTGPAGTSFDLILLSDLIFNHSQVRYHHHHHHLSHPLFVSRNE